MNDAKIVMLSRVPNKPTLPKGTGRCWPTPYILAKARSLMILRVTLAHELPTNLGYLAS